MNTTGWILMIGFWISISVLTITCLYRVLRGPANKPTGAKRTK